MLNTLLFLSLAAYGIISLGSVFLERKLYKRLREHHPEVWEQLHAPSLWPNISFKANIAVHRFLHRGEYRSLHDPELDRIATLARYRDILAYGLFAIFLFLLFFGRGLGL